MPQPISLTDSEMTAIMSAAKPLTPRDRDKFLRHIAQVLAAMPVRGDGAVYRAITTVWRQHFDPPDLRVSEGPLGHWPNVRSWGEPDMPGGRE